MSGLRPYGKREPLTWWRYDTGVVRVVCSQRHASTLLHIVERDGRLTAPSGKPGSLHCGVCNENLPLMLGGWAADLPVTPPEPPPSITKCDGCGVETPWLSGWTSCAQGLLCPDCWKLASTEFAAQPPPEEK